MGAGVQGDYVIRGYGKNVTGAGANPQTTYTVTNSAAQGAGTWESIVNTTPPVHDCLIQFSVSSFTVYYRRYLGENVTIDGFANGQNGVTSYQPMNDSNAREILWEDSSGSGNIIVRGINFRGTEQNPSSTGIQEKDLIAFDATNGYGMSGLLIERCTFMGGGDGGSDITGDITDVTVQHCLFYGGLKPMLCKYNTRQRITIWGNVFALSDERCPQIAGTTYTIDICNNIIRNATSGEQGWSRTAYVGIDVRAKSPTSDSPGPGGTAGIPSGNIRWNYIKGGVYAVRFSFSDGPGPWYTPDFYLEGNTIVGGIAEDITDAGAAQPRATPISIPSEFQVPEIQPEDLEVQVLDMCGAPKKTARDLEVIEWVRAILP